MAYPPASVTMDPVHAIERISTVSGQYSQLNRSGCVLRLGDSNTERALGVNCTNLPNGNNYVINGGIYGATLSDLIGFNYQGVDYTPLKSMVDDTSPNWITFLAGTNDTLLSLGNNNPTFISQWAANLQNVINILQPYPSSLLLFTIPPTSDGQHDNGLIQTLNSVIRSVAVQRPWITVCDLYSNLTCPSGQPASNALSQDGVHLSGAAQWFVFYAIQSWASNQAIQPFSRVC